MGTTGRVGWSCLSSFSQWRMISRPEKEVNIQICHHVWWIRVCKAFEDASEAGREGRTPFPVEHLEASCFGMLELEMCVPGSQHFGKCNLKAKLYLRTVSDPTESHSLWNKFYRSREQEMGPLLNQTTLFSAKKKAIICNPETSINPI